MTTPPPEPRNDTQTIAHNSFWYGLELLLSIGCALLVQIIVARVLGPERLGHYNYVMYLTNITTAVGAFGLAITTRKYMAEYLNKGQGDVARAVYNSVLRVQLLIAFVTTVLAVAAVFFLEEEAHKIVSLILVFTIAPRMLSPIPSQANMAAEQMKRNTGPSLLGGAFTIAITLYSLRVGWDLYGMAAGFVLGTAIEVIAKLYSVHTWLTRHKTGAIPQDLKRRMFSYSGQGFVLMILNIVVWDRSDVIILGLRSTDSQVSFFTTAFGLTEKLLMLPAAFTASLGATMMARFGRAEERVRQITVTGAKYGFLFAVPLLAGIASVSSTLVSTIYLKEYQPMIPVLEIIALLGLAKALNAAPTSLFQTVERQGYLIWTGVICGALDLSLDFLLIPRYGAVGAAWANGLAQTLAAIMLWMRVKRDFKLDLRIGEFARIAFSGAVMYAVTMLVQRIAPFSGYPLLTVAIATGAVTWFVMLRVTGALNKTDGDRIRHIGRRLPQAVQPIVDRCVTLLATS